MHGADMIFVIEWSSDSSFFYRAMLCIAHGMEII